MAAQTCAGLGLGLLGFVMLGCGQGQPAEASQGRGGPGKAEGPIRVEVLAAETGQVTDSLRFLGRTLPALEAGLAASVSGHVTAVRAREGDTVRRGQVLLLIESSRIRSELAAARAKVSGTEAELAQAQRQYARVKDLSAPAVSDPEREGFEVAVQTLAARLEKEKAEVLRVKVELAAHSIEAPFAGVLAERRVDPGAWIERGTPVLELVSLEQLEVHVDVSAEVGTRLAVGQTATLIGPQKVPARIEGIVPALDPTTRTMLVRLAYGRTTGEDEAPAERPHWLLSGRALEVAFDVELAGDGVLVPRDAVLRGALDTRVMTVRDGRSHPVSVEVLAHAGDQALVRGEGLRPGSEVIVRGNERLAPGQEVDAHPYGATPSQAGPSPTPSSHPSAAAQGGGGAE